MSFLDLFPESHKLIPDDIGKYHTQTKKRATASVQAFKGQADVVIVPIVHMPVAIFYNIGADQKR